MPRTAPAAPRLFHEDVVVRCADAAPSPSQLAGLPAGAPGERGVVVRCWHDEAEALPPAPGVDAAGIDRALRDGELGVAWYPSATREIVRQEQLQLWDRAFQVGDVARRSGEAGSSDSASTSTSTGSTGIVTDVAMTLQLAHVLSGQRVAAVPAAHVANALRVLVGDHVVHARAGWVGVVEEVFEEGIVQSSVSADLVRVCDVGSRLSVGEKQESGDVSGACGVWPQRLTRSRRRPMRHRAGAPSSRAVRRRSVSPTRCSPSSRRSVRGACCDPPPWLTPAAVAVNWLALSQRLEPAEQDARPRPKRFWDADMTELTLVRSFSEHAREWRRSFSLVHY
jgi:ubiquitin-conjugating enzyme E2 O